MSDPSAQLATLRALRETIADPAQLAVIDGLIAQLTAQQAQSTPASIQTGDVTIGDVVGGDQTTIGQQHTQHISGAANVGVAVAGNVAGSITVFFTAAGLSNPSVAEQELVATYLARLAQRCDRLRISGAVRRERRDTGPALTLSQVYVALAAETWELVQEASSANAFADALKAGDPDQALPEATRRVVEVQGEGDLIRGSKRANTPRFRLERPLLLTKALSQRRQLVLLGGPGSGKSSFLRHLAVALARVGDADPELPGWSAGRPLPLYASLGAFAAWAQQQKEPALNGPGLWRYLLATAQEYGLSGLDEPLNRAFRNGGLLLLLDGLDEVAEPALRAGVARAVAALGEAGGHIAVTCRVRSYEGTVAEPFAAWGPPVTLAPFALGQMRHFVAAWYARSADQGAIEPDEATQRVAELSGRLALLPNLRDLGQTPLLLTIITILHFYEGKLPEDRADLYEDLVQLLLTRWTVQRREAGATPPLLDQLKADGRLGGLKEYHLRNTLEALAYRAHQESPASDGRGLLDRDRVRGAFQRLFEEFDVGVGPAAEKADQVLNYLEEESGLLLGEGGALYGLPHLSYEEYLAGCHLGQQAAFRSLAYGHWQRDPGRWREVIFLALGRMVRGEGREAAAGWLDFLLRPTHGERERDLAERQQAAFFASECLAEMGGKAALIGASTVPLPQLWTELAAGLVRVVEGELLPAADRMRAGVWLGELGDPRIPVTRDEWRVASNPHSTPPMAQTPYNPLLASYWCSLPGGSFVIGFTPAEIKRLPKDHQDYSSGVKNTAAVPISDFALARYPVTNAQYQLFIEAGGYDPAVPWWSEDARAWLRRDNVAARDLADWHRRKFTGQPAFWADPRFGQVRPNHPVIGVNWYEATAFCAWLTHYLNDRFIYRLPSEAEWEYAARGAERRMYPWLAGELDGERANYADVSDGTTAVGCFPAGATPEGLLDMAGNVWEWTRSAYEPYPYKPTDGRENGLDLARKRFIFRGGSWGYDPIHLRAVNRSNDPTDFRNQYVGFRLARHLKM